MTVRRIGGIILLLKRGTNIGFSLQVRNFINDFNSQINT
nr:MAG TPA: hypothetical protein [Caudoviricetes sp.]